MRIIECKIGTEDELIRSVRSVRLKGFDQDQPYERSGIGVLRDVYPRSLVPAQRYVLVGGVNKITSLYWAFKDIGVNIFALTGLLEFRCEVDGVESEVIPFTPPIVEESGEDDGKTVKLINDGMHRVYAAKRLGQRLNVVYVTNPSYPYYAKANPNGWADVSEFVELPDGFVKKTYRNPDNYKALFRDFNAVFQGIQKDRKPSNPEHLRA